MLGSMKLPTLQEQQVFLGEFLKQYTTAQSFEPFILQCEAFKAKKSEKYVVQLLLNPSTPLARLTPLIDWAMASMGGEAQQGPPPRGELVRQFV